MELFSKSFYSIEMAISSDNKTLEWKGKLVRQKSETSEHNFAKIWPISYLTFLADEATLNLLNFP